MDEICGDFRYWNDGDTVSYSMPEPDEFGFVKTLNGTGYMTTYLDELSKEWVMRTRQSDFQSLDVGAAFGVATLEALKGPDARVVAIDLDKNHLEVLNKKATLLMASDRLDVVVGDFPDGFDSIFPDNYFGNILIARVLHFFDGPKIKRAARWCFRKLRTGGAVVVVTETP